MSKRLNQLYLVLACLICFSIPLMTHAKALPNILSIAMLLILIINSQMQYKKIIKEPYFKALLLLLAYIVLHSFLKLSLFSDYSEILNVCHLISLVYIFYKVKTKKYLVNCFVLGVTTCSLITLYKILILSQDYENLILTGLVVEQIFSTQRLYLGFFLSISIILCLDKFFYSTKRSIRLFNLTLVAFFTFSVFIFSSRSSIIILLVVFLTVLLYKLQYFLKHKVYLIAFSCFLIAVVAVNLDTLEKRFLYSDDMQSKNLIVKAIEHEPRILIWKFSFQLFFENKRYFFGLGNENTEHLLQEKYKTMENKKRAGWFLERGFNTHSQFVDITLNYGLIGLILFTNFFIALFYEQRKNIFFYNLIASLFIFTSLENVLNRQMGVYIIALIIIISTSFNKETTNE